MPENQNENGTCGGLGPQRKKNWTPWIAIVLVVVLGMFFYSHEKGKDKTAVNVTEESAQEAGQEAAEPALDDLKEGREQYLQGKFEEAKEALERAAEKGSEEAKAMLGAMYVRGDGVKADIKKGMEMIEESAKKGSAYAKSTLGRWYVEGKYGLEKMSDKGIELIDEAIDTGKYYGYVAKARLYEVGDGVEKDFDKAVEFLKEAGKRGYERAEQEIEEISKKASYTTTAKQYAEEYPEPDDEENAYLGRRVRLTGVVKSVEPLVDNDDVIMVELDTEGSEYRIICEFDEDEKEKAKALVGGQTITIHGVDDGVKDKTIRVNKCKFPEE